MAIKQMPINLEDSKELEKFLSGIDYVISDCDGVLWLDDRAIEGSPTALNRLRALGKHIIFVTNNDTKTRQEFCQKLQEFGFEANVNELYPTSYLMAKYLKDRDFNKKVYIVGESGIADELNQMNIRSILDPYSSDFYELPALHSFDPEVGAVILGMDYSISFRKAVIASTYIRQYNTLFLASSADEKMPNPDLTVPGPGAILALIENATEKHAVCLGKPSTLFFDIIRSDYPFISEDRCVMIGDRLITDIPFGHNNHMKTLFVETGINSHKDMLSYVNSDDPKHRSYVPHYYMKSLNVLNKYL